MANQYQHYVQKAYLERWKVNDFLYLFDKSTGLFHRKKSGKSIMGMEAMQTDAMETAFARVESCIGHTDHTGEIQNADFIRLLSEWMALHLIRNALNAATIGTSDYRHEVARLGVHLAAHYGFWMDFSGEVFIAGDNPVVTMTNGSETFYVAALSPRRCVYLVAEDKIPMEGGKPGLMPPTINRYICNAATRYCVSFDSDLHLK